MSARVPFRDCPLCSGALWAFRHEPINDHARWVPEIGDGIYWMRCNGCAHICTSGYFLPSVIWKIPAEESQKVGYDVENQRWVFGRMLEPLARFNAQTLLDVGFGNGGLMFTAQELGYRVAGIDLRQDSVDAMQAMGFDAKCCMLEDLTGRFDVIAMCDVLEHMPYPRAALVKARELSDALLLSVPNAGSVAWSALSEMGKNPYWREIEHFHNFTRARLVALLAETGWKVASTRISERYRLGIEMVCEAA